MREGRVRGRSEADQKETLLNAVGKLNEEEGEEEEEGGGGGGTEEKRRRKR